jgi:hypothetical protein
MRVTKTLSVSSNTCIVATPIVSVGMYTVRRTWQHDYTDMEICGNPLISSENSDDNNI